MTNEELDFSPINPDIESLRPKSKFSAIDILKASGIVGLLAFAITLAVIISNIKSEPLIWVDTDVGFDDLVAITMLMQSHVTRERLRGYSTVHGDCNVRNATVNLARVLQYVNRTDLPVYEGAAIPPPGGFLFPSEWVLDGDNLTGVSLPPLSASSPIIRAQDAASALVQFFAENPGSTLLAIGPMTNLNAALQLGGTAFVNNVGRIVAMAGAFHVPGNAYNNVSEWNVYGDAQSLEAIVERFSTKLTVVPLDAIDPLVCPANLWTTTCLSGASVPSTVQLMCEGLRVVCAWPESALADPTAAGYVIDPSIFQRELWSMSVVTDGLDYGRTVVDAQGILVHVVPAADRTAYYKMLEALLVS